MKSKFASLIVALFMVSTAYAGVIRHDIDDSLYRALAQQSQFDPVGDLLYSTNGGRYRCSGTLISSEFVLTAAHCLDDNSTTNVQFSVGGVAYNALSWFVHQSWNPLAAGYLFSGWDIALLKLDQAVSNVQAATLYEGTNEIGQIGTHVGFGASGTGLTGDVTSSGTKRAGQNEVDEINFVRGEDHARILWTDFDAPSAMDLAEVNPDNVYGLINDDEYLQNPIYVDTGRPSGTALDLEYAIGGGDSGGGFFIYENDEWYLAGVHSFTASIDTSGPNSSYGDFSGSTRVSSFIDWIDDTQALMTVVSTPNTALILFGFSIFLLRRKRLV